MIISFDIFFLPVFKCDFLSSFVSSSLSYFLNICLHSLGFLFKKSAHDNRPHFNCFRWWKSGNERTHTGEQEAQKSFSQINCISFAVIFPDFQTKLMKTHADASISHSIFRSHFSLWIVRSHEITLTQFFQFPNILLLPLLLLLLLLSRFFRNVHLNYVRKLEWKQRTRLWQKNLFPL